MAEIQVGAPAFLMVAAFARPRHEATYLAGFRDLRFIPVDLATKATLVVIADGGASRLARLRPGSLFGDIAGGLLHPLSHPRPIAVTILFTSFLLASYLVFYSFARLSSAVND